MADHSELVAEMPVLEQMGTQERQKLAKKRRLQQLKKWGQREKEWIAKEKQLNKRLANMLHEENNGLNLKQYTSYSSNHRSKKKLQLGLSNSTNNTTTTNNNNSNGNALNSNNYHNNNNNLEFLNNNISNLNPHGRVRFNVGVMLLEAAARNDFDEVKRLLSLGVSPDSINHDGLTALHQCCIDASEPMMNLLLEYGANVDAKDTEQWTPLHAACTCGHLNLVKILVAHDANLLAVNGDGNMPFDICEDKATSEYIESQMHKRGITQEMIDFTRTSTEMQLISDLERQLAEGGDLDAADSNGVTQLHIASANGYLMAVQFLLKNGVNVNVCDNDLWRPIHGAACWGNQQHAEVIELLVEAGAVLDAKTINDETVFDLCDNPELLERLNQLKDELESKQATGTDRLRRTQSRTNSRVHSVRRTSVRDKNQISRRDAREEALLRVENSPQPIVPVEGATTNGQQALPAASTSTLQQSNGSNGSNNDIMADKSSENEKLSSEELSKSSLNSTTNPSDSLLPINGSSQQVERKQQQRHNRHHLNKQSGVDDGEYDKQHIVMLDSVTDRSQSLLSTSSSNNLDTVDHHQHQHHHHHQVSSKEESATKLKNNNNHNINSSDHSLQHQRLVESKSETTLTGSASALASKGTSSNANNNTTAAHSQLRKANTASCDDDNRSNNDIACDPTLKKQQQQQQVVSLPMTPQLAPMNFTLSNLKKQRSEVRMRTTSIGGGIVIVNTSTNNNTTTSGGTSNTGTGNGSNGTSVNSNGTSYQVLLDPKPSSLLTTGNGNGGGSQVLHQRPESPSLTFRKFSGEPSELIGSRRGSRHECCILI